MPPSDLINPTPPLQPRSRRTLERILSATERLLEREPFEAITVRKIVKRARASIGSFYARFRDKQALLPALYTRYEVALATHLEELERALATSGRTLDSTVTLIVEHFVRLYGGRPHLMRSLAEYARRDAVAGEKLPSVRRRAQHEFMHRALVASARSAGHAPSARAAATALYVVDATCRERLLYPTTAHARAIDLDDDELVDELVRMVVAYLATQTTRSRRNR